MEFLDMYDDNLPELLNDFLIYLNAVKAKSPNTINGYSIDLKLFLKFLKKSNLKLKILT